MNWVGTRTLMGREVQRFLATPVDSVAGPIVTTGLFFLVFGLADRGRTGDASHATFIVPGLIYLGIANAAFGNTSSSMFFSKNMRTVEDLLMAPLTPGELLVGLMFGGVVRGLLVGVLTGLVPLAFNPIVPARPLEMIFFCLVTTWLFSAVGLVTGIWAPKFDRINLIMTFIIGPLTFFSGVFYRINTLPAAVQSLNVLNPMVYLVDGLRGSMLGGAEAVGPLAIAVWCGVAALATAALYGVLRSGWKLKS